MRLLKLYTKSFRQIDELSEALLYLKSKLDVQMLSPIILLNMDIGRYRSQVKYLHMVQQEAFDGINIVMADANLSKAIEEVKVGPEVFIFFLFKLSCDSALFRNMFPGDGIFYTFSKTPEKRKSYQRMTMIG